MRVLGTLAILLMISVGVASADDDVILGQDWYGQLFVDTRVAIIDGKDRGVYEQQSAVHG